NIDLGGFLSELGRDTFVRSDERGRHLIGQDKNADAAHACLLLLSLARWFQRARGRALEERRKLRLPLHGHARLYCFPNQPLDMATCETRQAHAVPGITTCARVIAAEARAPAY